jgi:uncharacterized membrane protein YphA (DoxX/SURF4 family)
MLLPTVGKECKDNNQEVKRLKNTIYWIATILIALETFAGGIVDLTHGRTAVFSGTPVTDVVVSLGYPVYVLAILGVWKIPGAITLIVPGFLRLKEWAYAGIVFELSAAAVSQAIVGHVDPSGPAVLQDFLGHRQGPVSPAFLLGVALVSWALRPPSRVLGGSLTRAKNEGVTPIRSDQTRQRRLA